MLFAMSLIHTILNFTFLLILSAAFLFPGLIERHAGLLIAYTSAYSFLIHVYGGLSAAGVEFPWAVVAAGGVGVRWESDGEYWTRTWLPSDVQRTGADPQVWGSDTPCGGAKAEIAEKNGRVHSEN